MKKYLLSQGGISLLEVLIASSISAILIGLIGILMTRPQRMLDTASERLSKSAESGVSLSDLGRSLSRTYVMKAGLFDCLDPSITQSRAGAATITLNADGQRFSFPFSVHSSIVGISNNSLSQVIAMDATRFPVGSMVMITHLHDASFGGVFRVTDSDTVSGTLTLASTDGIPSIPIGCRAKVGASYTLAVLATDQSHKVFNQDPTTFRADLVRYASYRLEKPATKEGVFDLQLDQWPMVGGGGETHLSMQEVIDFRIEQTWQSDGTANGGTNFINYIVHRREVISRGVAKASEISLDRELRGTVGYPLGGSLRRNFGAPTTPSSVSSIFPTCALSATPISGVFRKELAPTAPVNLYRVDGLLSNTGGRLAVIQASLDGPTGPTCWPSGQTSTFDFTGRIAELKGMGFTLGFSLIPGASGGLDPVYCDLPPGSSVSGQLSFYDDAAGKNVTVTCSGVVIPNGGSYQYVATASTCDTSTGLIHLGSLIDTVTNMPGPTLYVDETSCLWSDGSAKTSCRQDNGTAILNPGRTLTSVSLRPSGIVIANGSTEVTCN